MELLRRLEALQAESGLSGARFAKRLDVSEDLWSKVVRGKRPIRFEILRGALRAYPKDRDLRKAVLEYIAGGDAESDIARVA